VAEWFRSISYPSIDKIIFKLRQVLIEIDRRRCSEAGQVIDALRAAPLIGFLPDYLFPAAPDDIVPVAFDSVASLKREMVIAWHPATVRRRPIIAQIIDAIAAARRPPRKE
jgi:DNA-binding transcriptional LysR family regulator